MLNIGAIFLRTPLPFMSLVKFSQAYITSIITSTHQSTRFALLAPLPSWYVFTRRV